MSSSPTTTQRPALGHDAPPERWLGVPTARSVVHAVDPPVGSDDVATSVAGSSATHSDALAQNTASSGTPPSIPVVFVHAEAPPLGLVELRRRLPALPEATARHRLAVGQVTLPAPLEPPAGSSTAARVHARVPPVGFVDATRFPRSSAATQSAALAQATEAKPAGLAPSTAAVTQLEAAPAGVVEVITLPLWSTATHRLMVGHDTPVTSSLPSMSMGFHVDAPPDGLIETTALPLLSTSTQKLALGHEMLLIVFDPSMSVIVQADTPPVGFVEMSPLPALSTATQRLVVGHDTAVRALVSARVVAVHVLCPPADALADGEVRGFEVGEGFEPPDPEPHATAATTTIDRSGRAGFIMARGSDIQARSAWGAETV